MDLTTRKMISGVMIQGGFYEDLTGILFERREVWVTEFAVSYATAEGQPFRYVLYNGGVQVSWPRHLRHLTRTRASRFCPDLARK